jgi:pyrroloquinoline-quinone synthase
MTVDLESVAPEHRAFLARLLDVGARKYHDKHPFHALMNSGRLGRDELKVWALNRFYYQRTIPLKDAAILSNTPDPAVRRRWIQRIIDHDGRDEHDGGIEAWLRLVEAVGATRAEAWDERRVLPGVRFAVDAYLTFCRTRPWIDAVASSLTELFAPRLHQLRLDAFIKYYPWVDEAGLAYGRARLRQARDDVAHGVELVTRHCTTPELQDRAVAALEFKCDLLWAQLDAIHAACGGGGNDPTHRR